MTTRETALLVTLGVLALYSVQAQATGQQSPAYRVDVFQNSTTVSQATAAAAASARSTASAIATGGSAQATGGSATAQGGAGGSSSVTINNTSGSAAQRRTTELRTTGIAPDISANATAPCRIALGAGGGWIGGALSIFGSVLDEGCEARSDAAMLMMIGKPEAAVKRLCARPELAKALGCEALGE